MNNRLLFAILLWAGFAGISRIAQAQITSREPPPSPEFARLITRAERAMDRRAFDRAEQALQEAAKIAPDHHILRFLLGTIQIHMQRYEAGITVLGLLFKERPNDLLLQNNLAWAYARALDPDVRDLGKALALSAETITLDPDSSMFWDTFSEVCGAVLEFPDGMEALSRLALNIRQRQRLGIILLQKKRYAAGLTVLDPLLVETPDDPVLLNNMAWVYANLPNLSPQRAERAVALARRAMLMLPWNMKVWHTLGATYFVAGDYDSAARIAKECLRAARLRNDKDDIQASQALYAQCEVLRQELAVFE